MNFPAAWLRRGGGFRGGPHWRCTLMEFGGGEADHVHLLVGIDPALNLSALINHLKFASARRMRNRFADHLRKFYGKPCFWHRAYDVGSLGGVSLDTVKRYVAAQGTKEKPRTAAKRPPPVTAGNPHGT